MIEKPEPVQETQRELFANLQAMLRDELKNANEGTERLKLLSCCDDNVQVAAEYYREAQHAKDSE